MGFLAIFNANGAPTDAKTAGPTQGAADKGRNVLSPSRQVALRWRASDADLEWKDARHAVELDGQFWLLGRIRLDRRGDLCACLGASEEDSDALLYLKAYAHWGEGCVERLYGDFCFVLW